METVALALVESNWDLVFHAATGEHKEGIVGKRVHAGLGVIGWVAHEGEGVVIPNVRDDKRFVPAELFSEFDVHAMVIAPIYAQGRVIGILEAINPVSGVFDSDALLVLTGIGNLAGSTIQHAQLFGQLQTAHKRYRQLFDDSVDPILVTGSDGNIHEANRQAELITEYSSRQLQGMSIDQLHDGNSSGKMVSGEKLKGGKIISYESVLNCKSGKKIPIQVNVRKGEFEENKSLQWLMRDISERKELDSLREELTSMIYHDLRSPLANIISSLDVLSTLFPATENEAVQSVTTIARRSTDRIQRLVSSLLDINRLEAGQAIVSQQNVNPQDLAGEALEAVRPMTDSRRQVLKNLLPDKLTSVWVDVDMIRRVLINLLENASKYTPPEGSIELGGKQDGQWVQLWIQDTGTGIPKAEREHIFEKYIRLKGQDNPSGLGVGLAFCRLAVNGHGGKIWVESEMGAGSRFIFTLPSAKDK